MKTKLGLLILLILTTQCKQTEKANTLKMSQVVDTYFGEKIEDPYRWLENLEDSTTISWLKDQKKVADLAFAANPGFDTIFNAIKSHKKKEQSFISKIKITDQDQYFYLKRLPIEKIAKLYKRNTFSDVEELLYDPAAYQSSSSSSSSQSYVINYIQPSWDLKKLVIGLTKNDEEYSELVVLDIASKKIISGVAKNALPNSLGGIEWLPDNNGFIYTHTPVIDPKNENYGLNRKIKTYRLNKKSKDQEVFFSEKINSGDSPITYFTNKNNPFVLLAIANVSSYRDTYYKKIENLSDEKLSWKKLYGKEDKIRQFFLFGNDFYYRTSKDASNFKICKTDLSSPDFNNPEVLVDETKDMVISDFAVTSDGIYVVKTKNGVEAKLYFQGHTDKENREIVLPRASGHINISSKGKEYAAIWMTIEGWTNYKETYLFDLNKNEFTSRNLAPITKYDFLDDVIVEEIEVPSHDGVMVPLSIIYKKRTQLNGQNRMLINAYGAYKWSNSPYLYDYLLYWLQEGGIYVTAHVRGGGEKGNDWHLGGYKTTKPNSWKDLIACTEFLIDKKYTTNNKTALWGASAGGVTIGRAITERPDLFKTAFIRAGILNTLRREFGPNGKSNTKEYGTVKDSIEFMGLLAMDAYHHIKNEVQYPSLYLTAGMKDSRVSPSQPAKFAAKIVNEGHADNLILFDTDFEGGHGFETAPDKREKELAKVMTFLLWQTGHPDYQPE
ncbi:prolyl oligopeptidase family serine peptidase [uncultured Aquimarina sp.]|uniref:prolyl oligopeptidase family serine peptidase n=1 Tax=uncultured Aquimarina sp. TaxID=575652 RepID=UPI00261B2F2B|nr:prolyl oligopeptidase family serine peptidase [uncultured Aquimarina sp.]